MGRQRSAAVGQQPHQVVVGKVSRGDSIAGNVTCGTRQFPEPHLTGWYDSKPRLAAGVGDQVLGVEATCSSIGLVEQVGGFQQPGRRVGHAAAGSGDGIAQGGPVGGCQRPQELVALQRPPSLGRRAAVPPFVHDGRPMRRRELTLRHSNRENRVILCADDPGRRPDIHAGADGIAPMGNGSLQLIADGLLQNFRVVFGVPVRQPGQPVQDLLDAPSVLIVAVGAPEVIVKQRFEPLRRRRPRQFQVRGAAHLHESGGQTVDERKRGHPRRAGR